MLKRRQLTGNAEYHEDCKRVWREVGEEIEKKRESNMNMDEDKEW